jgi:hypothetical protein
MMATATIIAGQYELDDGEEYAAAVTLYNVHESQLNDLRFEAHWRNQVLREIDAQGHEPVGEVKFQIWTAEIPEDA